MTNEESTEFKEYSQLLVASQIFSEYLDVKRTLNAARRLENTNNVKKSAFPNNQVEPESYCTNWLIENAVDINSNFKHTIFNYFINLVVNYPKACKHENNINRCELDEEE